MLETIRASMRAQNIKFIHKKLSIADAVSLLEKQSWQEDSDLHFTTKKFGVNQVLVLLAKEGWIAEN